MCVIMVLTMRIIKLNSHSEGGSQNIRSNMLKLGTTSNVLTILENLIGNIESDYEID